MRFRWFLVFAIALLAFGFPGWADPTVTIDTKTKAVEAQTPLKVVGNLGWEGKEFHCAVFNSSSTPVKGIVKIIGLSPGRWDVYAAQTFHGTLEPEKLAAGIGLSFEGSTVDPKTVRYLRSFASVANEGANFMDKSINEYPMRTLYRDLALQSQGIVDSDQNFRTISIVILPSGLAVSDNPTMTIETREDLLATAGEVLHKINTSREWIPKNPMSEEKTLRHMGWMIPIDISAVKNSDTVTVILTSFFEKPVKAAVRVRSGDKAAFTPAKEVTLQTDATERAEFAVQPEAGKVEVELRGVAGKQPFLRTTTVSVDDAPKKSD